MGYEERFAGRECGGCGARSDLFVVIDCLLFTPKQYERLANGKWAWAASGPPEWHYRRRASCVDRRRCEARRAKREARSRTRGTTLVLAEPKVPDAPRGTCRWCGEELTGANPNARNYCYPEREGRDCRGDFNRSRCFGARDLVQKRGDPVCVDCGSDRRGWEADHDLALEDGGEHSPENIVRRCVPCHREKTTRENAARAAARRADEPTDQLALLDPAPT